MTIKKVQLYLDRDKTIEASPETSANCVILSDGNDLQKVLDNDLTTPTVVHEETSFKVGVGDVNVSSSVVDGEVGRMVIKGKTYQNILPEPSTPVLTNNKEMFKVNEGLDPNVEVVDGVGKSAILSGQTLVNLSGQLTHHEKWVETGDDLVLNLPSGNGQPHINVGLVYKLKKDTIYTVVINMKLYETGYPHICFMDESNRQLASDREWTPSSTGVLKTTFTTSSTVEASILRIIPRNGIDNIYTIGKKIIILEGDYTNQDIPYFEGMSSCKMPVLTTTGKNLWDNKVFENCPIATINSDGSVTLNGTLSGHWMFEYTIDKGTYCSSAIGNDNIYVHLFWQGSDTSFQQKSSFIISERVTRQGYITKGTYDNVNIKFQLEHGTVATSYEPYKSNILSCQLAPLNQSMFEQGTFAESTPPNTQSYESIKLGSEHLYTTRIRTKGTYKVVQGATYEVQLNDGYGIFICYCKNGLYSATINRWLDGTRFTFTVPNDCDEMFFAIRKTDNSAITPSDYPLIGLKIHQEVVLRSLPNGVKDTLNLNTGEYVQRIGEIVLDGSQSLVLGGQDSKKVVQFIWASTDVAKNTNDEVKVRANYLSAYVPSEVIDQSIEGICTRRNDNQGLYIALSKTKVATRDINLVKEYLQANPITAYYELATPVVKTVDLSSSGNWEKVVFDGSENWSVTSESSNNNAFFRSSNTIPNNVQANSNNITQKVICDILTSLTQPELCNKPNDRYGISLGWANSDLCIRHESFPLTDEGLQQFKQYLSQNPITVWYQTTTHKDSTQVKQPIFFKDGHIQLSSGADNSLIPTLDYQAKTSNSYVMNLMKANTPYTIKATQASGKYTLNGNEYYLVGNGTINSGSGANFLVITQGSATDLMFLEGNLKDKTIPYFKGIKSAFEDESKIEVLSTGKNLFDPYSPFDTDYYGSEGKCLSCHYDHEKKLIVTEGVSGQKNSQFPLLKFKPNTTYTFSGNVVGHQQRFCIHNESKQIEFNGTGFFSRTITTGSSGRLYVSVLKVGTPTEVYGIENLQIEESPSVTTHATHKSNDTKIPLLSPLRSLPNGVCDELIIDRMKKKATLIKRLDCITFDGSSDENWHSWGINNSVTHLNSYHYVDGTNNTKNLKVKANPSWFTSRLGYGGGYTSNKTGASLNNSYFAFSIPKNLIGAGGGDTTTMCEKNARKWLSQNPVTVYYELATPVVTEIDLESFPLVYKDGHIFLNSEIAPVVEIDYNVNQAQQIQANNETLQRHELDILDLDNLIVSFVNAEYKLRLLKFNMELSMMALAE